MSPTVSRRLVLVLALASLVEIQPQAAILHQFSSTAIDGQQRYHLKDSTTPSRDTIRDSQLSTSKFIILTTGDQIKLYPLVPGARAQEDFEFVPTYGHYLVKPRKAGQNSDQDSAIRLGENSLSQQLFKGAGKINNLDHDGKQNTQTMVGKRNGTLSVGLSGRSILPSSLVDWHDEAEHPDKIDWKEPWIVDVDYFFDPTFCYSPGVDENGRLRLNDCLVIVWLDKNNKVVRYGSLNLAKTPIETLSSSSSSSSRNKVLWLREFEPIRVVSQPITNSSEGGHVFGMVVDKRRAKLYVAFSDGSKSHPNRVLSGKLKSSASISKNRLHDETILRFNECKTAGPALANRSFENLSLDEDNGDWLFYFDQYQGGKIFALNVNARGTHSNAKAESEDDNQSSASSDHSIQALVRDIPLGAWPEHVKMNKVREATGIAMDSGRRQLYWLDEVNQIHSCDYAGYNAKLIGKLSPKPVIRSPHSMHIFKDTLYLSDPIKKSLIAYKLPSEGSLGESDKLTAYLHDNNGDDNGRPFDTIRSTHQVLIVEMPTIYGFRLVDTEDYGRAIDSKEFGLRLGRIRENDFINNHKKLETTLLGGGLQPYLEGNKFIQPGSATGTEPDYSHLLLDRIYSNFQCGYDQPNLVRRSDIQYDWLLFFLIELCLLTPTFVGLWFVVPRLRQMIAKAREDRLIKDSALISEKCQV